MLASLPAVLNRSSAGAAPALARWRSPRVTWRDCRPARRKGRAHLFLMTSSLFAGATSTGMSLPAHSSETAGPGQSLAVTPRSTRTDRNKRRRAGTGGRPERRGAGNGAARATGPRGAGYAGPLRVPLSSLSRLGLAGADEPEMVKTAVGAVADALGVDMASYLELGPGQDAFVLRAAVGWPDDMVGVATTAAGERTSWAGSVLARDWPRRGPGPGLRGQVLPVPDRHRGRSGELRHNRRVRLRRRGAGSSGQRSRASSVSSATTRPTRSRP